MSMHPAAARAGRAPSALLLAGCLWALATAPTRADSCCAAAAAAGAAASPLPRDSVYQLEASWTNGAGEARVLAGLRGNPRIVAMFYASCDYACPMLVADLKKIEAQLPPGSGVVFTLFSFDPARDTPEALRAFAARQGIAQENWMLLTGGEAGVRELAATLGVRYRKDPDGAIAHSNQITLLDSEGRIAAQLPGLNEDPAPLLRALAGLAAGDNPRGDPIGADAGTGGVPETRE